MRIAVLASGFVDYSLELAAALADAHEVAVFADAHALAREREGAPAPPAVELRRFRQDNAARRWTGVATRAAALAAWRPDAILAHEHPHPHLTVGLALADRIAPVGLIVHDPTPHPGRDAVLAVSRKRDVEAQRRSVSRLLAHGEKGAHELARQAARPVLALRHGPILAPHRTSSPPGERRVLMFGRMEAYKGLDTLLEAHRRLRARGRSYLRDLRGEGPELELRAAAFLALGGCQVSSRFVARPELSAAIGACDIVAAPYSQASASGVAAAAMANGRGLVATPVGELADMARDGMNARLAPAGDPGALALAIERGLDEATALGRGASELARGPFAWRHAAAAVSQTLAEAVGERRAKPGRAS